MKIYRPIKTNNITQKFGENNVCTELLPSGEPVVPFRTTNKKNGKCPDGYDSLYETLGVVGHAGTDFKAWKGEPIYFDIDAYDANGKAIEWEAFPQSSVSGGYGILIRSRQPIELKKAPIAPGASLNLIERQYTQLGGAVHLMRYYGHMDKPTHLKTGDKVKFGQKVGVSGTTGASTGVHVHRHLLVCGTNEVNPWFYLDGDSDYKGRIDESSWFENEYVLDVIKVKKKALSAILKALELIGILKGRINNK